MGRKHTHNTQRTKNQDIILFIRTLPGLLRETLLPSRIYWELKNSITVAKDIALIQPSSAFMERVFSILRACLDERQETCYSDRITASALLRYNRGRKYLFLLYQGRSSLYCCAVYPCDIGVWLQFPVLNLVFL